MNTKKTNKLKFHRGLSVLTLGMGIVLLILMITVEDEPGALPLLLIISGSVWYFINRKKIKSLNVTNG